MELRNCEHKMLRTLITFHIVIHCQFGVGRITILVEHIYSTLQVILPVQYFTK